MFQMVAKWRPFKEPVSPHAEFLRHRRKMVGKPRAFPSLVLCCLAKANLALDDAPNRTNLKG